MTVTFSENLEVDGFMSYFMSLVPLLYANHNSDGDFFMLQESGRELVTQLRVGKGREGATRYKY